MRILLSTIGSRGDVQPLVALGMELRALGQDVHFCVPPDFREWIESFGFSVTPIGPELRQAAARPPAAATPPTPEMLRQIAEATIATQFQTVTAAAQGCDLIVGATALQLAARSVAERLGIPYVFAAYCPTVLPSPHHAPIPWPGQGTTTASDVDNRELWAHDAQRWNGMWSAALNSHRVSAGLPPVDNVRHHIFTDRPWLAADPTLAPWPEPTELSVVQTGAWVLPDERPLSPELEAFLSAGEPPVYFGFGSTHASQDLSQVMIQAARALGCRAIVSQGWAELSLIDDAPDCLAIGEANLRALFPRLAAVVHHGGAGTTTLAALAGVPQFVLPQVYDQPYWAERVQRLGIGAAHAPGTPTPESLTDALGQALQPGVTERAHILASAVSTHGARDAVERLIASILTNTR